MPEMTLPVHVRPWRRVEYLPTLEAMRAFTSARDAGTPDELWLVEHPPVYTQGLAGRAEHVHDPADIPVIATERGGQVTYHGPGQVVAYLLLDLRRRSLGVRELVQRIEQGTIDCLASLGIAATTRPGAPGVHVADGDVGPGAKIASIGLKVSRGCTYHGMALNVAMDLSPFERIDPCGYPGLAVTDVRSELAARRAPAGVRARADTGALGSHAIADPAAIAPLLADALVRAIGR